MQLVWCLVLVAACGSSSGPSSASDRPLADEPDEIAEPTIKAPALPTASLRILSKPEQEATARRIAASFPTAWKAKVKVDLTGLATEIELALSLPAAQAEQRLALVELVADRASAFGVRDPEALHAEVVYNQIYLGEGTRWTGELKATVLEHTVWLYGHLWPIDTPADPAFDPEPIIQPFLGLTGSQPSRCCGRKTSGFTMVRSMFRVRRGLAFVCKDGAMTPRLAVGLSTIVEGHTANGLEKLPQLVDATTGEPITADFVLPPNGHTLEGQTTIDHVETWHRSMRYDQHDKLPDALRCVAAS